jgi:hypothetical protein
MSHIFSSRSPTVYAGSEIKSTEMTVHAQSIDTRHVVVPVSVGHIEIAENVQYQILALMLFYYVETSIHQLVLQ